MGKQTFFKAFKLDMRKFWALSVLANSQIFWVCQTANCKVSTKYCTLYLKIGPKSRLFT